MKRDNDYIRSLLAEMEASDDSLIHGFTDESDLDGPDRRHYHFLLMADAGLVHKAHDEYYRLTNDGHDFLEATRTNIVWEKAKAGAHSVGGMTLRMLFETSVEYLKQEARRQGIAIP